MDRRLNQMKIEQKRITAFCRRLSWVLYIFFIAYCLTVALVAWVSAFPPASFSYVGPSDPMLFIPMICNLGAGGVAIFVIARMLQKVGKGLSPFSLSSSRQIKILAIILLIGVVSEAIIDPGARIGSESTTGSISFGFSGSSSGAAYESVHIDFTSLLVSIICFALSPIFRYGALLQSEADDLM